MRILNEYSIGYWSSIDGKFHATVQAEYDNDGSTLHLEIDGYRSHGWHWIKTLCHGVTVRVRGVDEFFEDVKDLKSRGEWFWGEEVIDEMEQQYQDSLPVDEFDPRDTRI